MERKLRTYNCEEKAYRTAMKRARMDGETPLAAIVQGFVRAYAARVVGNSDINVYVSCIPDKKNKKPK